MKGEKAEPGQQTGRHCQPAPGRKRHHQRCQQDQDAAHRRKSGLLQAADQKARAPHVGHAAGTEQRNDAARRAQREAHLVVQVGSPYGQHTQTGTPFDHTDHQDDARPRRSQNSPGLACKAKLRPRRPGARPCACPGRKLGRPLAAPISQQHGTHDAKKDRQQAKRPAPAQRVGKDATHQLSAAYTQRSA